MATQINGGILAIDGTYFGAGTTVLKTGTYNVADMADVQWGYYVPTVDGALDAASTVGGFYQSATVPTGGKSALWFMHRPSSGISKEICLSCADWAAYQTAASDTNAVGSIAPANSYTVIATQPA